MIDALWRGFYRLAFRLLRLWWRLARPHHRGALVALWHDGRVLLVRSSYRPGWGLPGGGIGRGETARQAALREVREEIGLELAAEALVVEQEATHRHEWREDHTIVFALECHVPPPIRIDRREIVAARFMTVEEALRLRLPAHLRQYLNGKRAALAVGADR